MYALDANSFSYWWIVPIVMIIFCFLMMRGRMGTMLCGMGPRGIENNQTRRSDTAMEILDKRYASGEISREEYEERKSVLNNSTGGVNK